MTDRASFVALEQFIREIKESASEEVSFIIVGNKTDETRVVSTEEGQGIRISKRFLHNKNLQINIMLCSWKRRQKQEKMSTLFLNN